VEKPALSEVERAPRISPLPLPVLESGFIREIRGQSLVLGHRAPTKQKTMATALVTPELPPPPSANQPNSLVGENRQKN
jgi:hypothetical protein